MDTPVRIQWRLSLFGAWHLSGNGSTFDVAGRQQRLITALALRGARSRAYLAGFLWPNSSQEQASGSLRSCLWQISGQLPQLLALTHDQVSLDRDVVIDLDEVRACMRTLQTQTSLGGLAADLELLQGVELLPGWYDDWVIFEQERFQLLRLGALENLAEQFLTHGNFNSATHAATMAVSIEPMRESAQRVLIRSHLAGGNQMEALNAYRAFRARLHEELGAEPSAQTTNLIWPPHEQVDVPGKKHGSRQPDRRH